MHEFRFKKVATNTIFDIPPWTRHEPIFNYERCVDKKSSTDPLIFKTKFNEIKDRYSRYPNFEFIYTDGSKDAGRVAAAAVADQETKTCRLPDQSSIFTAELKAIELALDYIEDLGFWRFIFFTYSKSAMQALPK